jgi:NADPH:quinone reductase-like Zn-dependent oxidoreductase
VPLLTPFAMMTRNQTVSGVHLGHLWNRSDLLREELAAVLDLWRAGAIRPLVDGVYPFDQAAAAHRRIGELRNIGKIVLVP